MNWQDFIVLSLVGFCGLYIVRLARRVLTGGPGGCNCSSKSCGTNSPPIVSIQDSTSLEGRKPDHDHSRAGHPDR